MDQRVLPSFHLGDVWPQIKKSLQEKDKLNLYLTQSLQEKDNIILSLKKDAITPKKEDAPITPITPITPKKQEEKIFDV